MKTKRASIISGISSFSWLFRTCAGAAIMALLIAYGAGAFAQSVEKAETSQQSREKESELERARVIVEKPKENKPSNPETGRTWGVYSTTTSLELGYRFVDSDGNNRRYLSDVNVRDGFRVLGYSLDMRARPETALLFDFLKADVNNAGGDAAQTFYMRADKTRFYRFDGNVRRFNYYRSVANFVAPIPNTTWRDYDLRQQISDFNLKLFPQRAVRINAGYSRSMAKGRYTPTYSYQSDQYQLLSDANWESNDYRLGLDATYRRWDFNVEQLYRNFQNDPTITAKPGGDLGLNPAANNSTITTLTRFAPFHSRSLVTRAGVHGTIAERLHVVFRVLHDDEGVKANYLETAAGKASNGTTNILSRTLSLAGPGGIVKRPGNNVDAGASFDLSKHVTISDTFNYTDWRISGDMTLLTATIQQPATGPLQNTLTTVVANGY